MEFNIHLIPKNSTLTYDIKKNNITEDDLKGKTLQLSQIFEFYGPLKDFNVTMPSSYNDKIKFATNFAPVESTSSTDLPKFDLTNAAGEFLVGITNTPCNATQFGYKDRIWSYYSVYNTSASVGWITKSTFLDMHAVSEIDTVLDPKSGAYLLAAANIPNTESSAPQNSIKLIYVDFVNGKDRFIPTLIPNHGFSKIKMAAMDLNGNYLLATLNHDRSVIDLYPIDKKLELSPKTNSISKANIADISEIKGFTMLGSPSTSEIHVVLAMPEKIKVLTYKFASGALALVSNADYGFELEMNGHLYENLNLNVQKLDCAITGTMSENLDCAVVTKSLVYEVNMLWDSSTKVLDTSGKGSYFLGYQNYTPVNLRITPQTILVQAFSAETPVGTPTNHVVLSYARGGNVSKYTNAILNLPNLAAGVACEPMDLSILGNVLYIPKSADSLTRNLEFSAADAYDQYTLGNDSLEFKTIEGVNFNDIEMDVGDESGTVKKIKFGDAVGVASGSEAWWIVLWVVLAFLVIFAIILIIWLVCRRKDGEDNRAGLRVVADESLENNFVIPSKADDSLNEKLLGGAMSKDRSSEVKTGEINSDVDPTGRKSEELQQIPESLHEVNNADVKSPSAVSEE